MSIRPDQLNSLPKDCFGRVPAGRSPAESFGLPQLAFDFITRDGFDWIDREARARAALKTALKEKFAGLVVCFGFPTLQKSLNYGDRYKTQVLVSSPVNAIGPVHALKSVEAFVRQYLGGTMYFTQINERTGNPFKRS